MGGVLRNFYVAPYLPDGASILIVPFLSMPLIHAASLTSNELLVHCI